MNNALKSISGEYTMLHYPFVNEKPVISFAGAQENLVKHCISKLKNKKILDIGCGNGILDFYLLENYKPHQITGVDLNNNNILIGLEEKKKRDVTNLEFYIDDAQCLSKIKDNTFDLVINIESAFHYKNKKAFINEIFRVLKPGGYFVIADILTTKKATRFLNQWKLKMNYHHWTIDKYINAFSSSNLTLLSNNDISNEVINGFKFISNLNKDHIYQNYFHKIGLKMFFKINIMLNIYLLKKKRKYYTFSGKKPEWNSQIDI